MIRLFTKLRISNAIDTGRRLPIDLQAKIARSADLLSFSRNTTTIETVLKAGVEPPEPPAALRVEIMDAVRAEAHVGESAGERLSLRGLPATALAAAILLIVSWVWLRQPLVPLSSGSERSLAAATEVFNLGTQFARIVPSAVVAPLSEEAQRLDLDVEKAAQFLLASIP